MGIDLRPCGGWQLVKGGHGWELRHSPSPGRVLFVCRSDEHGAPSLYGLRDLLNRELGTPSLVERVRLWISAALGRWSRRVHPDFWPDGRHGMHRPEPIGSWLPPSAQHTGAATYRTARADELP